MDILLKCIYYKGNQKQLELAYFIEPHVTENDPGKFVGTYPGVNIRHFNSREHILSHSYN